jgi:hypothetical protein
MVGCVIVETIKSLERATQVPMAGRMQKSMRLIPLKIK